MKTPMTCLLNSLKQSTSFLAGLSIAATSMWSLSAPAQAAPRSLDQTVGKNAVAIAQASTLPNGTYLYGQSEKPDEIGKAYRTTSNAHLIYGWDVTLCGFSRSQSFP